VPERACVLSHRMLMYPQASMQLSGLGPALWWVAPDDEEPIEEEEETNGGAEEMNGDAVDEMDEGA
jgi:DNA-directed RNA polymerase III subunit RPC8